MASRTADLRVQLEFVADVFNQRGLLVVVPFVLERVKFLEERLDEFVIGR